ncbi:MAG: class I SAM-dependent methyltransferase [Burkholderiales bacterium]
MARLHLGCFNCPADGWVNTDVTPHLRVARVPGLAWLLHRAGRMTAERYAEHRAGVFRRVRYLDATRPWPFADGAFEAIYSSHMLEHLPLRGARLCVAEARRCLRPGGVLRIAVPDLDAHIAEFRPEVAMSWAINLFEANESSEKNMHHFMYNFASMSELLREAGFGAIERRGFGEGRCPDVRVLDNRPESLFVEARAA